MSRLGWCLCKKQADLNVKFDNCFLGQICNCHCDCFRNSESYKRMIWPAQRGQLRVTTEVGLGEVKDVGLLVLPVERNCGDGVGGTFPFL